MWERSARDETDRESADLRLGRGSCVELVCLPAMMQCWMLCGGRGVGRVREGRGMEWGNRKGKWTGCLMCEDIPCGWRVSGLYMSAHVAACRNEGKKTGPYYQ